MRRRTWLLAIAIALCSGCDGSADGASVRLDFADLYARESAFDGQMVELTGVCLVANRHGMTAEACGSDEDAYLALVFPDEFPADRQSTLHSAAAQEFIRSKRYLQGDVRGIYRSSESRPLGRLLVHEVTLHSPANSPD